MISGWYANGTEIVFACGGSMFQSISAAASANDGYVIGVDVDQSGESDAVVTSAMKGLSDAVQWAVAKVYDGTFTEIGGTATILGVKDNAVAAHRRRVLALRDLHRGGVRGPVPADAGRHPGRGQRLLQAGEHRVVQRQPERYLIGPFANERGGGFCLPLFYAAGRRDGIFLCFARVYGIIKLLQTHILCGGAGQNHAD